MSNLISLKIFLKDSPKTNNKHNKDLIKFLKNNLTEIVDSNFYTRLIIVDQTNIKKFMKIGVKKTPALLNENESNIITGVENIIQYIISKCEDDEIVPLETKTPKKKINCNNSNDVRDYLMEQAMSTDSFLEDTLDLNKAKDYEKRYNKKKEIIETRNINTNKNIMNNFKKNDVNHRSDDNNEVSNHINNTLEVTQNTRNVSDYIDNDDEELKKFWQNLEETEY